MNTNLMLVTNVPKSMKQFDLLKELENKWARILFIDNPYFDLIDVFIYNPTNLVAHYELGVRNLREKVINGSKPLKVYHLWFPPPNICLTNLIPENSMMLPFLFVDNLPKECDSFEIIGELPFQQNEVKHWDVPQKEDKWMILRLPANQDDAIRDYVLRYIRGRQLSNGLFPRVLEVFASEELRLSSHMTVKKIATLPVTIPYKSNLLFLYDLPTKMMVRQVMETAKSLNVKGSKAFFIDVVNGLRVGFLYIPRSLSETRFKIFQDQIKEKEIAWEDEGSLFLNTNEVWLQPYGAAFPVPFKMAGDDRTVEYVLTNYIYVHNVAACVDYNQLTKGSPITFKVNLFQVMENMPQVGFICMRGLADDKIIQLVKHLRALIFDGFQVMIDNIYLRCYDLPDNHSERRDVHIPRKAILMDDDIGEEDIVIDNLDLDLLKNGDSDEIITAAPKPKVSPKIEIAKEPSSKFNLQKSDFIFINKLPNNVDASLFSFLRVSNKCITMLPAEEYKAALIYYPDTTMDTWCQTLENIATSKIHGNYVEVSEVYLQSEETVALIESSVPGIVPSRYVFIYNVSDPRDTRKLQDYRHVVRFSTMVTDSESCAFVELVSGLSAEELIEALNYIRSINIGGICLCADLIWLGTVKVHIGDKNAIRSKWLKKPTEPSHKRMRLE